MISVYVTCSICNGGCHIIIIGAGDIPGRVLRCYACDGLGRQWAPGAPGYGCAATLADRYPGEIVTLGTGERAKILWHMPRKRPKQRPETTFVDLLEEFTDAETYRPVEYPSCVGVADVVVSRVGEIARDSSRGDEGDPLQRNGGMLI